MTNAELYHYATCTKCGTETTSHRSGVCRECRKIRCKRCGREQSRRTSGSAYCHQCEVFMKYERAREI